MHNCPFFPCWFVLLLFAVQQPALAAVWQVGTSRTYTLPSQVAPLVNNGDTVEIDAGIYPNDVAIWYDHNLVLRGKGGMAILDSNGNSAESKAIWVIKGNNATVEYIEFAECAVPDLNGAGIRQEGTGLTVRYCYFHDNQMGILAGDNAASNILIEFTEFAYHGNGGGGYSHNVYINHVNSLTFRYNYSHHSITGHTLKSRAYNNYILYNRIGDEAEGTSSYSVDLPNGGRAYLIGNTIQQGPLSPNSGIISYGAEGLSNPVKELYMVHNTVVNNKANGTFVFAASGSTEVQLINNIFTGNGTVLNGTATVNSGNVITTTPGFTNAAAYNYHLAAGSPAIDAGIAVGMINGYNAMPVSEYAHQRHFIPRIANNLPDAGAYEFQESNPYYQCSLPQYSLQFYGTGTNQADRVKFAIDPPTTADVAFDFTAECWLKTNFAENNGTVSAQNNADGWITGNIVLDRDVYGSGDYGDFGIAIGHTVGIPANHRVVAFGVDRLGTGKTIVGTTNIADNQWHHVAVTRNSTTGLMRIFVDGLPDAQGTGPAGDISYRNARSTAYPLSDPFLVLGAEKHDAGTAYPSYNGLLDELRISGNERYTVAFTPPTSLFLPDAATLLLCHFNEGAGQLANDESGQTAQPVNGHLNVGGNPSGPAWNTDNPFYTAINPVITSSVAQTCVGIAVTYSVTAIPGSTYQWLISGNYTLIAGGGASDAFITLQWTTGGEGMVTLVQTVP
ncbi:hypothetical protein C7N43_31960 [Sphingobacteriales bacterium UPWRP_1]|nr:hypothetical protein BVG80_01460 [Sphingobacteriales bacterium TSM_CSM]PSJ72878.1 hypothetical protein C7N43_31960 [Sphingobacteriales bacterium UPWRP_1]